MIILLNNYICFVLVRVEVHCNGEEENDYDSTSNAETDVTAEVQSAASLKVAPSESSTLRSAATSDSLRSSSSEGPLKTVDKTPASFPEISKTPTSFPEPHKTVASFPDIHKTPASFPEIHKSSTFADVHKPPTFAEVHKTSTFADVHKSSTFAEVHKSSTTPSIHRNSSPLPPLPPTSLEDEGRGSTPPLEEHDYEDIYSVRGRDSGSHSRSASMSSVQSESQIVVATPNNDSSGKSVFYVFRTDPRSGVFNGNNLF